MQTRKGSGAAISAAIAILIGVVVLLPLTVKFVSNATQIKAVTNESIDATNGTTQEVAHDNLVVGSESIEEGGTTLTKDENYTISYPDGSVTFTNVNNTNFDASAASIDYRWTADSYMESTTSRTLAQLLPLLIILVIFGIIGKLALSR